jgi:hypothetical protein
MLKNYVLNDATHTCLDPVFCDRPHISGVLVCRGDP